MTTIQHTQHFQVRTRRERSNDAQPLRAAAATNDTNMQDLVIAAVALFAPTFAFVCAVMNDW
eukprot:7597538-Pyramimonas_sp.AAC.1